MKIPLINKLPSFKFKLPKPQFNFLKRQTKLSRVWNRFLKQIPPTYRHFIQSYPSHFIVIGDENSGKSQLIQKFIDQERDVYSFETSYTAHPDVQFYLGQRYVIQEVSWSLIEDRSISAKKQLAGLWRRLYGQRDPIFVITFDPIQWSKMDAEKINHYARLLMNKIVLLSHVIDRPLKVRIALTHMDRIEGYTELLRVLRMYGIPFDIPLSNYDNETLNEISKKFEEYLPLILKHVSGDEYLKVLSFFKKLSELNSCIDQFVRSMIQKEYEKQVLILEKAYCVSNQESDIGSEIFDCKQEVTPSVYIKRHYYKHRVVSACILLLGCTTLAGVMISRKHDLGSIRSKIALLERYQTTEVLNEMLPNLSKLEKFATAKNYNLLQPIYHASYDEQIENFVDYSRDYILLPTFRRLILSNQSEIEMVYFLSLAKATVDNRLGQLISENVSEWATMLGLPEQFVRAYVHFAKEPQQTKHYLDEFVSLCSVTPLSDLKPWFQFFEQINEIVDKPSKMEIYLPDLKVQAERLSQSLEKLNMHSLTPFLCKILIEDPELSDSSQFLPKIRLLQDLRNNQGAINELLAMVQSTTLMAPSMANQNLNNFLVVLDDYLSSEEQLNSSLHFILAGKRWMFETSNWTNLVLESKIKSLVDDYIASNRDQDVHVFFKDTIDLFDVDLSYLAEAFPQFKVKPSVKGCFTLSAYEKNILPISEKLAKLNQSKYISSAVKNQLSQYIAQSVESYARQYKEQYEDVLTRFEIHPKTFKDAKRVIGFMTEPLSHYSHFLHMMRKNLSIPESESLVLYPMMHLSEFKFFQNMMPEELDKPGQMHYYQSFLRTMLRQVDSVGIATNQNQYGVLEKYLTPLSRVSLAILTNNSASFQSQLEEWFEETQVPSKYHAFFLNPVVWVHELGLKELSSVIEIAWSKECEPVVETLFAKFPFNRSGTEVATYEEVEDILHPNCAFRQKVHEIIGDVSLSQSGNWQSSYPVQLGIDAKVYSSLNLIAKATDALWDNNGDPKPLRFQVRTVPFKHLDGTNKQIVLSYLIAGDQTLFNLNQQPHSETLEIKWWDKDEVMIGFELMDQRSTVSTYKNMKVDKGDWSFFQLMTQSSQQDQNLWSWEIPEEDQEFVLYFEENPWQVLNPLG